MRRLSLLTAVLILLGSFAASAASNDPITGAQFDSLLARQLPGLQEELASTFPETEGFLIGGPLDALFHFSKDIDLLYRSVHIICPDLASLEQLPDRLRSDPRFRRIKSFIQKSRTDNASGYRGVMAEWHRGDTVSYVQFNTIQQIRWLIWAHDHLFRPGQSADQGDLRTYAASVSDYLLAIDRGIWDASEPKAVEFGLTASDDFYAEPPAYVIEGYQNYKDYLNSHASITTDFARGIVAFIPGDSLIDVLATGAPREAFPNKEAPMLQHEYRKFFARGGDWHVMQTLTAAGFDTLQPGEYFFAVGLSGKVRFGYEMRREDVERIEAETGKKLPRANHAFLFPGEPVLTAGAFVIERGRKEEPHMAHLNAQSGHFFYSNVSPTIREDIALRSNHYLLTLGHFFTALERLGISVESILVRKL